MLHEPHTLLELQSRRQSRNLPSKAKPINMYRIYGHTSGEPVNEMCNHCTCHIKHAMERTRTNLKWLLIVFCRRPSAEVAAPWRHRASTHCLFRQLTHFTTTYHAIVVFIIPGRTSLSPVVFNRLHLYAFVGIDLSSFTFARDHVQTEGRESFCKYSDTQARDVFRNTFDWRRRPLVLLVESDCEFASRACLASTNIPRTTNHVSITKTFLHY